MGLALLLELELETGVMAGFRVFGISAPGLYRAKLEELGVIAVPLSALTRRWDPWNDLRAVFQLWHALSGLHLDVLHTHNPKPGVVGRIVGRLRGVPVVVNTCHGLWATPDDRRLKRLAVYGLEALAAWFSDRELYQNGEDANTMAFAVPDWKRQVVGNGIDLERFRFDGTARERIRRELGVPTDGLLVGGVGRQVEEKGIREFIDAAHHVGGSAMFVWVGPTDFEKRDAFRRNRGSVIFLGSRDDMPAVYSALDIFVLPTYREGFPRSAMEAAACGRPLVLTDVRGSREIGAHEGEALYVPARDSAELAAAIRRLVTDQRLREELGRKAEERARQAFDQRQVAVRSIEAYWAVASAKHLPWPDRPDWGVVTGRFPSAAAPSSDLSGAASDRNDRMSLRGPD